MNQARKSNFKTHVEKLNPTSRTDLSNKTLCSILYWKLIFKPFPYKSFGWCNAHSMQADARCKIPALGISLGPRGMYFPILPSSRQCTDTIHLNLICFLDRLLCVFLLVCRIPFARCYAAVVRCFLRGNKSVEVSDSAVGGGNWESRLSENVRKGKTRDQKLAFCEVNDLVKNLSNM